jgi:hypothetical protein
MVSSEGLENVIGSSPDRPISVIWEFSSTNRALNSIAYFTTADDADKWIQDVKIYAVALVRFDNLWKVLNDLEQRSSFQSSPRYANMRLQMPILRGNIRTMVQNLGTNLQIFRTYWAVRYGLIGQGIHYVPPTLVLLMTIMEDNLGLTGVRTFRNANGEYF